MQKRNRSSIPTRFNNVTREYEYLGQYQRAQRHSCYDALQLDSVPPSKSTRRRETCSAVPSKSRTGPSYNSIPARKPVSRVQPSHRTISEAVHLPPEALPTRPLQVHQNLARHDASEISEHPSGPESQEEAESEYSDPSTIFELSDIFEEPANVLTRHFNDSSPSSCELDGELPHLHKTGMTRSMHPQTRLQEVETNRPLSNQSPHPRDRISAFEKPNSMFWSRLDMHPQLDAALSANQDEDEEASLEMESRRAQEQDSPCEADVLHVATNEQITPSEFPFEKDCRMLVLALAEHQRIDPSKFDIARLIGDGRVLHEQPERHRQILSGLRNQLSSWET